MATVVISVDESEFADYAFQCKLLILMICMTVRYKFCEFDFNFAV